MISAGSVGAEFTIVDNAGPVLRALMAQFMALGAQIDKTQLAMRALAVPPGMNRALAVTETRMTAIADAAKAASDESVASFAKVDASAATTTASLAAVSAELRNIAAGAKAVNGSSLKLGGGSGGGGGAAAGGGRGGLWGRVTGAAGRMAGPDWQGPQRPAMASMKRSTFRTPRPRFS
jgi:hypothetical protein